MFKAVLLSAVFLLFSCNSETKVEEANKKESGKMENPVVVFETSMGNFEVELYETQAPETVKNFLQYVDDGFYNNTIFHRVIDNFMIQGGGFDTHFVQKKTRAPIKNEADNGLKNEEGTLCMARTSDPHSATAQFFINVRTNPHLDFRSKDIQGWGYAVFGKVKTGMDTIKKIKVVKTGMRGMHQDVPAEDVVVTKVTRK